MDDVVDERQRKCAPCRVKRMSEAHTNIYTKSPFNLWRIVEKVFPSARIGSMVDAARILHFMCVLSG